jgi:hypothetical protein
MLGRDDEQSPRRRVGRILRQGHVPGRATQTGASFIDQVRRPAPRSPTTGVDRRPGTSFECPVAVTRARTPRPIDAAQASCIQQPHTTERSSARGVHATQWFLLDVATYRVGFEGVNLCAADVAQIDGVAGERTGRTLSFEHDRCGVHFGSFHDICGEVRATRTGPEAPPDCARRRGSTRPAVRPARTPRYRRNRSSATRATLSLWIERSEDASF